VSFLLLDRRRSTCPTSRPAAPNLCFASVRLSPSTAGTRASFGVDVDGADVGCTDELLAGAGERGFGWVSIRSRGTPRRSAAVRAHRFRSRRQSSAGSGRRPHAAFQHGQLASTFTSSSPATAYKPTLERAASVSMSAYSLSTLPFQLRRRPSTPPAERVGSSRHIWRYRYRRLLTRRSRRMCSRRRSTAFASCTTGFPLVRRLVVPYPPRPDHAAILQRRMNDALARVSVFRHSTRKAAEAAAV
jgi:hypothetical protein